MNKAFTQLDSELKSDLPVQKLSRTLYCLEEIAHTSISVVFKCRDSEEDDVYAAKQMSKQICKKWKDELHIFQKIGKEHENVVRYIPGYFQDGLNVIFFMELCDASLEDYISNKEICPFTQINGKKQTAQSYFESDILQLLHQTANGLEYLHDNGIMHRDLKPSNVLLLKTRQNKTVAKVTDFGLSKELQSDDTTAHTASKSTKSYMASECYENRWKKSSDMFSFGVLCYYAITRGYHPFGCQDHKIHYNIVEKEAPVFDRLRKGDLLISSASEEKRTTLVDLIKRLVKHDPNKRLTVAEVLIHPAFYTAKKKLEYLKEVQRHLKNEIDEKILEGIKTFDEGLLKDHKVGKAKSFAITEKYLPDYFFSKEIKKQFPVWHIVCFNDVAGLLKALRDKVEHATDSGMPPQFYKDFGVEGGLYDHEKFLEVFLSAHPQLLVHLYEYFRGKNVALDFYPEEKTVCSSTPEKELIGNDAVTPVSINFVFEEESESIEPELSQKKIVDKVLETDIPIKMPSLDSTKDQQDSLILSDSSAIENSKRIGKETVPPVDAENNNGSSAPTLPFAQPLQELTLPNFDKYLGPTVSPTRNAADVEGKDTTIEELKLRDYQDELAKPGLGGENCIVLAPTGTGKTIVAAHICKKLIEKRETPRILFLVDRVPLVSQQFKVFQRFLGDVVFQVSGEKNSVRTETLIENHLMTVMTAEILYNLLKGGRISIENIDLLIFDECHHAMKKHVYNRIMWLFIDKHLSSSKFKLPQIIGLSASLSVGKAKSEGKAEENIKMLMANLNVTIAPIQVVEHIDSLKLVQSKAEEEVFTVSRNPDNSFANSIEQAMHEIETILKGLHADYSEVINENVSCTPQGVHGKQEYELWVVRLLEDSKLVQHVSASQWLMGSAKHLRQYNDALIMNDHIRSSDVKNYLEAFLRDQPTNESSRALLNIYKKNEPQPTVDTNPLLEKLRKILTFQYQEKPNSRCIIFVRTRPIANALLRYLAEQAQLSPFNLNAKLLTGTNAKAENLGMTKAGQEDTLLAFQAGSCKVLVSTSVAEEGLDIRTCNLVITYNYASNEVGKIQRKGRGRAEDSRFIILAYSDSGIVPRESGNDMRTGLANEVLKKISNTNHHDLKSEIIRIQLETKEKRDSDAKLQSMRSSNTGLTKVFKLLCVSCKTEITASEHIRHINKQHHVIIDKSFPERAVFLPLRPPLKFSPDVEVTGKIVCKNSQCNEKWGSCMNHKQTPVFVLSVKSFVMSDDSGTWCTVKQWNQVPFYNTIPALNPTSTEYLVAESIASSSQVGSARAFNPDGNDALKI